MLSRFEDGGLYSACISPVGLIDTLVTKQIKKNQFHAINQALIGLPYYYVNRVISGRKRALHSFISIEGVVLIIGSHVLVIKLSLTSSKRYLAAEYNIHVARSEADLDTLSKNSHFL